MGKGDGRRRENAAAIDANWAKAFAKRCDEHGPKWTDTTPASVTDYSGEIFIIGCAEYRALQRDAEIARHFAKVLPLVHAQMVKEVETDWPGS